MCSDEIETNKLRFEVVTVDCPDAQEFDLEEWLADILLEYWLLFEEGDSVE